MFIAGETGQTIVDGQLVKVTIIDQPDDENYTVHVQDTGAVVNVSMGAVAEVI